MQTRFINIPEVFENTVKQYPNNLFLRIKGENDYIRYTYRQTYSMVKSLALGLTRLLKRGEKAAILSENRPEWCIAYLAISSLGCTAVPLDTNLTEENLILFLNHSDAKLIFVSEKFAEKIKNIIKKPRPKGRGFFKPQNGLAITTPRSGYAPILSKSKIKKLRHIISFDNANDKYFMSYKSMMNNQAEFDITKNAGIDDVASLIYTSGTSGNPKGVMLTHANLLNELVAGRKKLDIIPKDSFILLLPLYHIFAFTGIFLFSSSVGASITFVSSLKKAEILNTIKETNITIVFGVPQLFESIYKGIIEKINERSNIEKKLVEALRLANETSVRFLKKSYGKLIFKQIHDNIGGDIKLMVSGGAGIKREVLYGMYILGFPIIEGYGLTETSPVVTVNDIGKKFGSVGKPLDGVEIKIAEPDKEGIGEIAVKGLIVMKGYYKNPELTNKTIRDGWIYTKDLGYIDRDGYLYIKGRKDNVIILSSGKNVYPEDVEYHYSKSPLIQEICVLGVKHNSQEHEIVHALIVPNIDEIKKLGNDDIYSAIKNEIEAYSKNIPTYKRVFSFDIVSVDSLPKTSTLKFKKFEIKKKISQKNFASKKRQNFFIEDFIFNVLAKYSKKANFDLNSHLETDLYLDSLGMAEIISKIEEQLKIKIPYDINPSISTVHDIVNLVSKYTGNGEIKIEIDKEKEEDEFLVPRRTDYSEQAMETRVKWLNKKVSVELKYLLGKKLSAESLKGNIEHYIGMSQIPTGIAGPIKINGGHAKGLFYVPLSTTEGALVASVNRGMTLITKSGGANARVLGEQLTKAPMFIFKNAESAIKFGQWASNNFGRIKEVAESTTRYGKLIRIEKFLLGRRLILKLCYTCGDALGANMITMATQKACNYIKENYPIEDYIFQTNLESEKKASYLNFISGRGKKVYADAVIKRDLVGKYLHTTVERIIEISQNSIYGSMLSGMIGTNAHIANIVTAIFIATGQDVAHVHDSSIGITTIDKTKEGDLYISVNLPSLAIGTVGGGTGLGTQRECLDILGCYGTGKVNKLAEIISASVLAGEISLAGSQAAGDFASAHEKLGRK